MGFNTQIRKALDDQLPLTRRFVALRGAVERFSPSGFNATFANLETAVGVADPDAWTEAQIVEAAQLLRQSRAHHLQHRALWDDERRVAKAHGIRQPNADEWDWFGHRSWLDRVSYSPRSRYRWVGLAEWVRTNGLSPSPVGPELEDDYRSLLDRLPRSDLAPVGSMLAHYGPFPSPWEPAKVIEIPGRIYNRPLSANEDRALPDRLRLLADAWYSRSHDGYVRQRHLKRLVEAEEHWVVPYVVAALGDYVVEVVEDVEIALRRHGEGGSWHRRAYHHFAANNYDFIELVRQRATSYHHCYYTASYSRDGVIRPVYPAFVALDRLTEADHYRHLYRVVAD
ncbi:MAG: hypothetical protein GY745_19440 [Actinomycetia bacterium]|nr:hypothetical protein [Actinomycetes bacterium]